MVLFNWLSLSIMACLLSLSSASSHRNDPIIIERPSGHVDFSEILLEYSREHAPEANMTIAMHVLLGVAVVERSRLLLSVVVEESWNDTRLAYNTGPEKTMLPHMVDPWQPDTCIVNALESRIEQTALFLSRVGAVTRKTRWTTTLPLPKQQPVTKPTEDATAYVNATLILGSFANGGASLISYELREAAVASDGDGNEIQILKQESLESSDVHLNPYSRIAIRFQVALDEGTVEHFVHKLESL